MTGVRNARALGRLLAVAVVATACAKQTQTPVDHRASDEAAIRTLDSAWVKAAVAKDAQQFVSYYADDASLLAPGAPIATGKPALQAAWTGLMALPGFALTFAPTKIDVSGDRAYEIGDYALTLNDKTGKPQTTKGKYVVVWGKQPDGTWKALLDAPTTTQ
ncbi:MAG TPA: SgcJ/EcaC family oxidoreductase [Gemmatimonadaceae bacterium]|jgi:uncharacterized protein (TIGR02246 family)|nr:SgcJ/EcaC family oxidoreductase [Gemmatimonadaceae bacterium]